MSIEELRPGWALPTRCWRNAMAAKDAANGGRGDLVAELEQFALDAAVAPTRILTPQAPNQLSQLV